MVGVWDKKCLAIRFRIRIPDQFSVSLTIVKQVILGDLLSFLIQSSADFTLRSEMTDANTFWPTRD